MEETGLDGLGLAIFRADFSGLAKDFIAGEPAGSLAGDKSATLGFEFSVCLGDSRALFDRVRVWARRCLVGVRSPAPLPLSSMRADE